MSLYFKIKRSLFPPESGMLGFTPQFRLEGRSRDANNEAALEMRIADPLWMLGRQWQFGEFRAEDNGSPIGVVANFRKERLPYYTAKESGRRHLGRVPLEAKVEAIHMHPKDLRAKVRIGQKFEALIREHEPVKADDLIESLRKKFPLSIGTNVQLDQKSQRFFHLMAGNVIDGGILWEQIQHEQFPNAEFRALNAIIEELVHWYETLFVQAEGPSAWKAEQLVHQFGVHRPGIALKAPDYQSGHLDWYSFDTANVQINPLEESQDSEEFMPVNVSFAAMPDKRLFAFEDSKFDLTNMEVEPTDLVRLMMIDFSMVSGSDWFTIPIEMELGEICWVNQIEVKDVFGVITRIDNEGGKGVFLDTDPLNIWDAFKIRASDHLLQKERKGKALYAKEEHFLYLPPVTTFRQESRPIEELLFLRDEYANMVWAIEKTVRNPIGKPTDGYDLHLELNGPFLNPKTEEAETASDFPRFRLASPVPTNWIPYLPRHINGSNKDIELKRAVMMRNEATQDPEDIDPISFLAGEDLLTIREEAIPRAGVRVQLTHQRVRGTDGNTYIWLGRKVLAGRGEGSSGLTFDQLIR